MQHKTNPRKMYITWAHACKCVQQRVHTITSKNTTTHTSKRMYGPWHTHTHTHTKYITTHTHTHASHTQNAPHTKRRYMYMHARVRTCTRARTRTHARDQRAHSSVIARARVRRCVRPPDPVRACTRVSYVVTDLPPLCCRLAHTLAAHLAEMRQGDGGVLVSHDELEDAHQFLQALSENLCGICAPQQFRTAIAARMQTIATFAHVVSCAKTAAYAHSKTYVKHSHTRLCSSAFSNTHTHTHTTHTLTHTSRRVHAVHTHANTRQRKCTPHTRHNTSHRASHTHTAPHSTHRHAHTHTRTRNVSSYARLQVQQRALQPPHT